VPLGWHFPEGEVPGYTFEKAPLSVSPLTESNRRPSPYHPQCPRFTAWQALPAGWRQHWSASCRSLWHPAISQAIVPAAGHQSVRSMPSKRQRPPAWLPLGTGPWGRIPAGHARADGQETVRRSLPSCTPRPDGRAEQASLERQEDVEPLPLSVPRMKVTDGNTGRPCLAEDHTAAHADPGARGTRSPERGHSTGSIRIWLIWR
jgi:hypothetical protein